MKGHLRGIDGWLRIWAAYGKKKTYLSHRPVMIEVPSIDVRHNGLIDYAVVICCYAVLSRFLKKKKAIAHRVPIPPSAQAWMPLPPSALL